MASGSSKEGQVIEGVGGWQSRHRASLPLTLRQLPLSSHPRSLKPLSLSSSLPGAIALLPLSCELAALRGIPRVCLTCPTPPHYSPGCPSGAMRPPRTRRLSSSQLHFLGSPRLREWPHHLPRPPSELWESCSPIPSPSGPASRALSSVSSPPSHSSSASTLTVAAWPPTPVLAGPRSLPPSSSS